MDPRVALLFIGCFAGVLAGISDVAREVNAAKLSWVANEDVSEAELALARSQLMKRAPLEDSFVAQEISTNLPTSWDARTAWPGCIHPVMDQGRCGSCWSFAASEVLSDRFCVASHGSINITLSPQNLLSCEKLNLGCEMGSMPEWAWSFLNSTGIATLECVPYTSGGGKVPPCQHQCVDSKDPFKLYKASGYEHVGQTVDARKGVEAIMAAVTQGPVDSTFNVYADFMSYKGGVYQHHSGGYEGLHSVKVIGYGVENGTDYWLVQNSWGTSWGIEGGFFKIIRGINDCGFETLVFTGQPLL